ncbi:MAG: hypothetical protein M5U17_16715 [Ignavibacterium sp.]|nr:hypothetical protein [Ignavibacterium sp.]
MWEKFKDYYKKLKSVNKLEFEKALLKNFESIYGSWLDENKLTNVIEYIWSSMSENTKAEFINYYIEIYFSNRKDHYEQKQFASKIVTNSQNRKYVKNWIEKKINEEIKSSKLTQDDVESEVKYFNRYYSKAQTILSFNDSDWRAYLTKKYKENIK